MSLFGQLAGQAIQVLGNGGAQEGQNPLIQIAGNLLQQHGGVAGLLEKFNAAGLSEQISSWISTGDNLPVDGSQIADALGHGTIADIAGKLGLPTDQIAGGLAQMLPQHGGVAGLLEKFNAAGLSEQISSWISTGDNLPVNGSQIADALGHGTIADIAGKLGLPTDQIAGGLAQMLPQLIDRMTPNGSTGGSHDLLEQGLSALGSIFNQPKAG